MPHACRNVAETDRQRERERERERQAGKFFAQVFGKDLDSESDEDLDDILFLESDETTKDSVGSFVSFVQMPNASTASFSVERNSMDDASSLTRRHLHQWDLQARNARIHLPSFLPPKLLEGSFVHKIARIDVTIGKSRHWHQERQ
jgi:hypothetical protein